MKKRYRSIAQNALQYALQKGCDEVKVEVDYQQATEIVLINSELDTLNSSEDIDLYIYFYIDDKFYIGTTNRLKKGEIKRFIDSSIECARLLSKDKDAHLPPFESYYKGKMNNFGLCDNGFNQITTEQKVKYLQQVDAGICRQNIICYSTSLSSAQQNKLIIASNGLCVEKKNTTNALVISLTALKDEKRVQESAIIADSHLKRLNTSNIATDIYERTMEKFNQTDIQSGAWDIIIDKEVSAKVLRPIISALSGDALFNKESFLRNKKWKKVASNVLTITDLPHRTGVCGASNFDSRGVATHDMVLVEKGVVKNYYITHYYGRKLKMEPTFGEPQSLFFEPTEENLTTEKMLKQMRKGLYITGFNGGNYNRVTGDFSFGIEGFVIENGVKKGYFSEALYNGNMLKMMKNIVAISADNLTYSPLHSPSIKIEKAGVIKS